MSFLADGIKYGFVRTAKDLASRLAAGGGKGSLTRRNLAPDPFFKLYRAGRRFIDGNPLSSLSNFQVTGSAGNPFADNVALRLPSGASNANSDFLLRRLNLKAGDILTVVAGVYAQQGVSFSAFLRNQAGTVVATATVGTVSFSGAGEYKEVAASFVIDATLKNTAYTLQFRSLAGQTSTSNVDICGYGLFVNAVDPYLNDQSFNDTDTRIRSLSHRAGFEFLPETRKRVAERRLGLASTLDIGLLSNSYGHLPQRHSGHIANLLKSIYGDAGIGWIGLGYPNDAQFGFINGSASGAWDDVSKAWTPTITFSKTGTWVPTYATLASPDLCGVATSQVGAEFSVNGFPASTSSLTLLATAQTGVVGYSTDGGSTYTNLDLSGSGIKSAAITVPPGAFNLKLKLISGTIQLLGLNHKFATPGVRFHKLSPTGGSLQQLASVSAANWQAGIAALGLNLAIIDHGPNDQSVSVGRSYPNFRADADTVAVRLAAALPSCDRWFIAPPENQRSPVNPPMAAYSEAFRDVASQRQCAFSDMQSLYGQSPADYASGSSRPWFSSDLLHADPANNGGAPYVQEITTGIAS